jgi:hypothetical protein
MGDMRTSEKIGLLSTLIGVVMTLAVGTGLSILLDGFVQGFLVLAVVAIAVCLFFLVRNRPAVTLQVREFRKFIEAARLKGEMTSPPPPLDDERVPLARRPDDVREYRE